MNKEFKKMMADTEVKKALKYLEETASDVLPNIREYGNFLKSTGETILKLTELMGKANEKIYYYKELIKKYKKFRG